MSEPSLLGSSCAPVCHFLNVFVWRSIDIFVWTSRNVWDSHRYCSIDLDGGDLRRSKLSGDAAFS